MLKKGTMITLILSTSEVFARHPHVVNLRHNNKQSFLLPKKIIIIFTSNCSWALTVYLIYIIVQPSQSYFLSTSSVLINWLVKHQEIIFFRVVPEPPSHYLKRYLDGHRPHANRTFEPTNYKTAASQSKYKIPLQNLSICTKSSSTRMASNGFIGFFGGIRFYFWTSLRWKHVRTILFYW